MFGMVSGKWTIIVISTLQDIATSSQPINQNVLDVVAANEIETESDSNTVKVAKKRGRPLSQQLSLHSLQLLLDLQQLWPYHIQLIVII